MNLINLGQGCGPKVLAKTLKGQGRPYGEKRKGNGYRRHHTERLVKDQGEIRVLGGNRSPLKYMPRSRDCNNIALSKSTCLSAEE